MTPIYGTSTSKEPECEIFTAAGKDLLGASGFALRAPVRFDESYGDDFEDEDFDGDDDSEDEDFEDDDFDSDFDDDSDDLNSDDDDDEDDGFDDDEDEDDDFDYDDDAGFGDLDE